MKIDHDAAARGLTVVVAAAGIVGSAIGLYSVYVGSGHPRAVGIAATVSTDGLALVAFFCAWRSTRARYPLFVGAAATGLSMAAQFVYYSGGAAVLSPDVKGAMSAWVPLSSILAAHLLLHAFGTAPRMLAPADQGHTQVSAPPPSSPPLPTTPLSEASTEAAHSPSLPRTAPRVHSPGQGELRTPSALPAAPPSALPSAPATAPRVHSPTASGVHSAVHSAGALGSALGFGCVPTGTGRPPARTTAPSAPPSALEPPAVTPPAAHSGVHSGPHSRVHSEVHSNRTRDPHPNRTRGRIPGAPPKPSNRTRERTDAELASALADAPGVHSVRAAAAHLKIGQGRAKRVLALREETRRGTAD